MSENEPPSKVSDEDDLDKSGSMVRAVDSSLEMDNLEERFSQQQEMISQLKEMVLAEETARTEKIANTRLKMEKYVSQLAKIRDRAKHKQKVTSDTSKKGSENVASEALKKDPKLIDSPTIPKEKISDSNVASSSSIISETPDIPKEKTKVPNREVTKLLHQQIKERKAMIAERTKNEKELEKALIKIQKQLEENQNQAAEIVQIGQSKLISNVPSLLNESVEANKTIIELRNKITQLEGNVLDLQETCKEKDNVIKSKTEAITLMSADLSKKGKVTLDLLDDTKEQMQQMQENFANMESNIKAEKDLLLTELEVCKNKITHLEEANTILESERFKLSIENTNLEEKLTEKEIEISKISSSLQDKIIELQEFTSKLDSVQQITTEEKGIIEISEMNALTDKIEILEKLNYSLRQSNIELQEKLGPSAATSKDVSNSPSLEQQSKASPSKPKGKFSKNSLKDKTANKNKSFEDEKRNYLESIKKLELLTDTLNKQILEKEICLSQKETEVEKLRESLTKENADSPEKSIDLISHESAALSVSNDTPHVIHTENINIKDERDVKDDVIENIQDPNLESLKDQLEDALKQIEKLSKDLSDSNKSMIKLKATHKTKIKQMQKSIDDYSKVSHSNAEVVRLQSEVNSLTQKIAELEDDKGNLQLHLVDYDSGRVSDSQLHAKLVDVENTAEERLKAIAELETQKFDLVQELHLMKQKVTELEDKMADLSFLENEHVSSEIKYAQLEEKLDKLKEDNKNISQAMEEFNSEKNVLLSNIESLSKEKLEINTKLDYFIQENMELIDRLEKLSAEKVSSAESIEMVESLTSQEKMEIEQYHKSYNIPVSEKDAEEAKDESNFSKIETDKTVLLSKIDLYSQERHEVIEKLENLQVVNNEITLKLEELANDKRLIEEQGELMKKERDNAYIELKTNEEKINQLDKKIEELSDNNKLLTEKLNQLSSPIRTEEVIVSETVEVEDTIEKEFIEYPTKSIIPVDVLESKHIETTDKTNDPVKSTSKGDKKFTKEILRLKNILKQKENEISSLNMEISELRDIIKLNDDLTNKNANLDVEVQELSIENISLKNQVITLINEKDLCNSTIIDLQQSNEDLLKIKSTLTENLLDSENKRILLENSVEDKNNEIIVLKNNESTFDTFNGKLYSDLENKISLLHNIINQNKSEISGMQSELYESFDCSDHYTYLINNLERKIEGIVGVIENKQKEITSVTNERNDIVNKILMLEKECLEKDSIINNIKQQLLETSECQQLDYSNSLSRYESDILKLNEKCTFYETNESKQIEEYRLLEEKCKAQCLQITEIETELKNNCNLCDELKEKIRDLTNNLHAESLKCVNIESNMTALQSEYVNLQKNFSSIESELQQTFDFENKIIVLENQLIESQTQITKLTAENKSTIDAIKYENIDLCSQNKFMRDKILNYESQINSLNIQNIVYVEKIKEVNGQMDSYKSASLKIQELEEQLFSKQHEINTLINELEELRNTCSENNFAHGAKIQEREGYIESLEIDLTKYKEKIIRLEENLLYMESLEKKANVLATKLEEKDLAVSESIQHEGELNKKLITLTAQDKLNHKQLQEIKLENKVLLEKIELIDESKRGIQNELDFSKAELLNLKNNILDLEVVEREKCAAVEKCISLESELRDLKELTLDYSEKLKAKVSECVYLDNAIQTQSDNFDMHLKQFKEKCKLLQEENSAQLKVIKDIEVENNHLRIEVENLHSDKKNTKKIHKKMSSPPLFKFGDNEPTQQPNIMSVDNFDLQLEISHMTSLLNEKDDIIVKLQSEIAHLKSYSQSLSHEDVIVKSTQMPSKDSPKHVDQLQTKENIIFDLSSLQDQIITTDNNQKDNISNIETPMIRAFCHDPATSASTYVENSSTKVEELIEPKIAFKCFDNTTSENTIFADLDKNEDSIIKELQGENILELQNSIEKLKSEKEKILLDLTQSQQKTNKALLKLKEYKLRYDNLNSELKRIKSTTVASDLDTAIQEELSSQVAKLEDKISNMSTLSEKEKNEKDYLLKRIDVLVSGNEKLLEMKEKQDLEMEVIKAKNVSLNEKVKDLQWGDDFDMESEEVTSKNTCEAHLKTINELNVRIDDLKNDNDNLQFALDDQKNKFELLIQNERQLSKESSERDDYKKENANLKEMLEESLESKNKLNLLLESTCKENDDFKIELQKTSENLNYSNAQLESLKNENSDLQNKLKDLVEEYLEFQEKYKVITSNSDKQELEFNTLSTSVGQLEIENKNISTELANCRNELSKILYEKDEYVEKSEALSQKLYNLSNDKDMLENNLQGSISENSTLKIELENVTQKFEWCNQNLNMCESYKLQLEQQINLLKEHLSEAKGKDSVETVHEICLKNANELTNALNDTIKQLQITTKEKDEYKEIAKCQLSEEIHKNNVLSKEYEDLKNILSEKENETIMINKELYDLRELLIQTQTTQLELQNVIQVKDSDLQKYHNFEDAFNKKVGEYNAFCNAKDMELLEKNHEIELLQHKLHDYDRFTHQSTELETKINDITHEKDAELADLRLKMHADRTSFENKILELSEKINYAEKQLDAKIEECRSLNLKMEELQTLVDEEAAQMSEMRTALEAQEMEIVTLKENLTIHVNAYDKLKKSGRHVTFSKDTEFNDDSIETTKEDPNSPRADLDLALYMLHQRDVRCEELTVELMQLLEERDTLQLKLSNAIRTNEELRKSDNQESLPAVESPENYIPQVSTDGNATSVEGSNVAEPNQEMNVTNRETSSSSTLETKLSQLHSVNHMRDIRLMDERESRQRQMDFLQRDIQNLPPEAAAQLREAHYTLSRDTQSASTVLFNWLWGRTTPKVVHM